MKYLSTALLLLALMIFQVTGSAEYIFKKDGAIIKGSILKDDPAFLMIKNDAGVSERVSRNDILRILYTDLYMGKVFARLTSGEVVEGYQVDEDRDNYTFRKDMSKPAEFIIPRKKVMFIARTNPTDLVSAASVENILIRWSPPFKPAKSYKIFMRENKKGEKFKVAGETGSVSYNLKNLSRSASYEVYVTAIGDSGEESLPSEKIIANTIPYSPEDLVMTENLSADNKTVTLTMKWKPVDDAEGRVKSYTIYNIEGKERKKLGSVTGADYVIKDFPAAGRHWFSVVAVNDLGAESEDVKVVYDAGLKFYTGVSAAYLVPFGDFGVIADYGYGGLIDFNIGIRSFSAGFETGFLSFTGAHDDIKKMAIVPLLVIADYRLPLFYSLSLRPVIKAGAGYNMTEYIRHDKTDPSETENYTKNAFDPIVSAGLYLDFGITDNFNITGGVEYASIFQDSGRMSFLSLSLGAVLIF